MLHKLSILLGLVLSLISCVPTVVVEEASCASYEQFNEVSRLCEIVIRTPIPSTSSASVDEDSRNNRIRLAYRDLFGELAGSCNIVSTSSNIGMPTCQCIGGNCEAVVTPDANFNGDAEFVYTITDNDGTSNPQILALTVTSVDDLPSIDPNGLDVTRPLNHNEDSTETYLLGYNDVDGDLAEACIIENESSDLTVGSCSCLAGICSVDIGTTQDFNGVATFDYRIITRGQTSSSATVTLNIAPVNDLPVLGGNQQITLSEGTTNSPFTVNPATDVDLLDIINYEIISDVSFSPSTVISSCMNSNTVLNCVYTPNGSVSDEDTHATSLLGGLRYRAVSAGTGGNAITINYLSSGNVSATAEVVTVNGNAITVDIEDAVSSDYQIKTAIESGTSAGAIAARGLVEIKILGSVAQSAAGPVTLAGGRDNADKLSYIARDAIGASLTIGEITFSITPINDTPVATSQTDLAVTEDIPLSFNIAQATDEDTTDNLSYALVDSPDGTVSGCMDQNGSEGPADLSCIYTPNRNFEGPGTNITYRVSDGELTTTQRTIAINIAEVDDPPIICDYHHFAQAPQCGLNGCVGDDSPQGDIILQREGVYYYQKGVGLCYRSNADGTWSIVEAGYIANQEINEKDIVKIATVVVDEGGDVSENLQQLQITSVTSSDTNLIPTENIDFFWGGTVQSVGTPFGSLTDSEDDQPFQIEIIPVAGQIGTATIGFQITDGTPPLLATTRDYSFTVTVNPVSAQHQGWRNIKAIGAKIDILGEIKEEKKICNYSRTKCNSGNACTGGRAPDSTPNPFLPDEQFAIYWDSTQRTCYYSDEDAMGMLEWVPLDSYCNITPVEYASECANSGGTPFASCILPNSADVQALTPTRSNNFYYALDEDVCYRSVGTNSGDVRPYKATSKVVLEWEPFNIIGEGTISGFNIHRRISDEEFDYEMPINKQVIPTSINSFTDDAGNSWFAPLPRTVYFYEVRPIIRDIPTNASEVFKTVRIVTPPDNMVMMHRWIANKTICALMHQTTDPYNHFRCNYVGPGSNGGYYDIGQHYLIDRFEAGCAYSPSPACDTLEGTCVGDGDPYGDITAVADSIYYNRNSGECYKNTSGSTASTPWIRVDETDADIIAHRFAKLPPLVYLRQGQANAFCTDVSKDLNTRPAPALSEDYFLGLNATDQEASLPSRLQQVAYSQWDSSLSDGEINTLETGLGISSSSKCNSSMAHSLTNYYSNSEIPDSTTFFSLPGTTNSEIRSIITGSAQTAACDGKFGVQDAIGNVAEYVSDRLWCSSSSVCEGLHSGNVSGTGITLLGGDDFMAPYSSSSVPPLDGFALDGEVGPCVDRDSDGTCDSYLTDWAIKNKYYRSGRFLVPMGLPGHTDFTINFPDSPVAPYLLEIGPSNGITNAKLHEDSYIFNTDAIFEDTSGCGAMATGGSYLLGKESGVYNFEMIPCESVPPTENPSERVDVGFRCLVPIQNGANTYSEAVTTY